MSTPSTWRKYLVSGCVRRPAPEPKSRARPRLNVTSSVSMCLITSSTISAPVAKNSSGVHRLSLRAGSYRIAHSGSDWPNDSQFCSSSLIVTCSPCQVACRAQRLAAAGQRMLEHDVVDVAAALLDDDVQVALALAVGELLALVRGQIEVAQRHPGVADEHAAVVPVRLHELDRPVDRAVSVLDLDDHDRAPTFDEVRRAFEDRDLVPLDVHLH